MTLNDFVIKYQGKYVEAGGSANALNQCVDLANKYIEEVLGLPKILWTNACDFPSKAGSSYEWIPNTPTGIPQDGDILVWSKTTALPYGHVAIFISGNVNTFNSFDQNWPTGSPAHVQSHSYITTNYKVAGWLRKRQPAPIITPTPIVDLAQYVLKSEHISEVNTLKGQIDSLNIQLQSLTAQLEEEKRESEALIQLKNSISQTVMEQLDQIHDLKTALSDAQEKNGKLLEQANKMELLQQLLIKFFSLWKKNS